MNKLEDKLQKIVDLSQFAGQDILVDAWREIIASLNVSKPLISKSGKISSHINTICNKILLLK